VVGNDYQVALVLLAKQVDVVANMFEVVYIAHLFEWSKSADAISNAVTFYDG
jgi:hypothetical protein